jgi:hypothetical protein
VESVVGSYSPPVLSSETLLAPPQTTMCVPVQTPV